MFIRGHIATDVHQLVSTIHVDTIVIACTPMRAAATIEDLERQTGKVIVSSSLRTRGMSLKGCLTGLRL